MQRSSVNITWSSCVAYKLWFLLLVLQCVSAVCLLSFPAPHFLSFLSLRLERERERERRTHLHILKKGCVFFSFMLRRCYRSWRTRRKRVAAFFSLALLFLAKLSAFARMESAARSSYGRIPTADLAGVECRFSVLHYTRTERPHISVWLKFTSTVAVMV